VAQQCAEKALKAVALARGFDRVKSHSILDIARALGINGEIEKAAKRLDLYYMTARYPDALPAGAPFDYFTSEQAEEAVALAGLVLKRARAEMPAP
jgi:HEPN domain-containing protein